MERPWWQGTKESLWPTVSEKLRPSGQQLTRSSVLPATTGVSLEVAPPSVEPSNQTAAQLTIWLQTPSDLKAEAKHWDTLSYKSQKHTADWKTGAISQVTPEKQPINPLGASWDSAQLTCQRRGAYFKVSPSAMDPYSLHTTSHSRMYTSSHDWILTCSNWGNKRLLS